MDCGEFPSSQREREREIVIFCVDLAAAVYGKWQIGTTEIESVERKVSNRTKQLMYPKLQAPINFYCILLLAFIWFSNVDVAD